MHMYTHVYMYAEMYTDVYVFDLSNNTFWICDCKMSFDLNN